MRRTLRFVFLLGSLIASAGWAAAGDRTASDFYVGDPSTAGAITPANRGKAAEAKPAAQVPVQPPAAPLTVTSATVDGVKGKTAAAADRLAADGRLAAASRSGPEGLVAELRRRRPAAAAPHGAVPLPPVRPVGLAQAAPVPAAGPTTPPSVTHPPQAASHSDRADTPAEVHAAAARPAMPAAAAAAATAPAGRIEKAAPTFADLLARHAAENGVPLRLAKAVVTIESRGNVRASNGGALGLMQIKPQTARSVGFNGGAAGLFEPEINLRYGMKILGQAYKASGGDLCKALVHYQSGHAVTRMNAANRAYCLRARAVMAGA